MTAEEYLRRVGFELHDLPWSARRELVAELRAHLAEAPSLDALGTPEQYAADLRLAAGLERRRGVIAFIRRVRPRTLVFVALALTVLGLAIGAVAWVDSYQPLAFAGGTQAPLDAKPSVGAAGMTVVFRKGRPFEYGITIHNSGPFTVRVLSVPRSVTDFYVARLLMSQDQSGRLDERPLERFQPFDMKPGAFRWLVLKGVFACTTGMGSGTGTTWDAIPVRFGFLWRTRTAWIRLDEPLTFQFPKACPPRRQ